MIGVLQVLGLVGAGGSLSKNKAELDLTGGEGGFAALLQHRDPAQLDGAPLQSEGGDADMGSGEIGEATDLLLEAVGRSLTEIAGRVPQDGDLSQAGWSRVEQALVSAVKDGFAEAGIAVPEGLIRSIEARFEAGPAPFAALQEDVRALIAGRFTALPKTASGEPARLQAWAGQGTGGAAMTPVASTPVEPPKAGALGRDDAARRPLEALFVTANPRAEGALSADGAARTIAPGLAETASAAPIQGATGQQTVRIETPQPIQPMAPTVAPSQVVMAPDPQAVQITPPDTAQVPRADTAPSVLNQIRSVKVSEGRTRIELSPASLGALEIEITSDEAGQLRVVIRAESAATLAALRSDRQELADMLTESGFDFEENNLDFEGFERDKDGAPSQPSAALAALEVEAGEPDLPVAREAGPPQSLSVAAGRLDILT